MKIENGRNFFVVVLVNGEAQAYLDARLLAVPDALHGRGKGPVLAPEAVVDRLHPVQADAHVGKAEFF